MTFSIILNINFTFVFPSCKCLRLHIMTKYKLFMEIFLYKNEFIFLSEYYLFLLEHCQIFQFSRKVLLQIPGDGIRNVFSGSVSGSC
jgi:hypothetical protein